MEEREKILNYNDGSTSQSRIFFRATSKKKKVIETEIEEGKEFGALDIDAIFKTGKKILGIQEKVISGEITILNGDELSVKVYMFDDRNATFTGKRKRDIDGLLVEAAEYITEQTTPQYLVEYLIKKGVSKNDSSSLVFNEKLLDKADKLLGTLEYNYNYNDHDKDSEEKKIQLVACRTSWHLAKAIEYQLKKKVFKSDSLKWAKAYDNENIAAWKVADTLKFSNDLAHYVLKLSILVSVINGYVYENKAKIKEYENHAKKLILNYEPGNRILSASFWNEKSNYFELRQAKGFINLSIGYLSNHFKKDDYDKWWDKYDSERYFKKAIKCFHNQNTDLSVDNNEIAACNSLAYYFKKKAESAHEQKSRDSFKNKAIETLEEALLANKRDGNIYDTYAETIFDLNGKYPDSLFYEKIRQALSNPKPVDGITVENYRLDSRWDELCKFDDKFRGILDSIDKKNKEIYAETKKKKKDKSKNGDSLPPQYNARQKAFSKNNDAFSISDRTK